MLAKQTQAGAEAEIKIAKKEREEEEPPQLANTMAKLAWTQVECVWCP